MMLNEQSQTILARALDRGRIERAELVAHEGGLSVQLTVNGTTERFDTIGELRGFLRYAVRHAQTADASASARQNGVYESAGASPTSTSNADESAIEQRDHFVTLEDIACSPAMAQILDAEADALDADPPAFATFENPFVEALRITIDFAGMHKNIYLGPTVRKLEKLAHHYDMAREEFVDFFKDHNIGHVEHRPGDGDTDTFAVLILNEDKPLVEYMRSFTGVTISDW